MRLIIFILLFTNLLNAYSQINPIQYDSIRAVSEININGIADANPWLSPDALRLYYTHGPAVSTQIMFSSRASTSSLFNPPVVLPINVPNPISCWFSNNELNAYVTNNTTLFFTSRNSLSSAFSSPIIITLTGHTPYTYITNASLNSAEDKLYLSLSDSTHRYEISEFARTSPTSFSFVRKLTPPPGYVTGTGVLSKNGLSYLFDAFTNNGNRMIYQVNRNSTNSNFNLNNSQLVPGLNDTAVSNVQASMSDSLNWIVFTRSWG